MTEKTRQKNELIIALRQLANHMQEVAESLKDFEMLENYPQERSKELVGASLLVREWAEQVELLDD